MAKDYRASKSRKAIFVVLYALPLIGLAIFGGYYFKQYQDLKNNPLPAEQAAQAEVDRYVREVGELYSLPADEEPSVATVKDKDQLAGQEFFAQAENGDVTLIYTDASLAILYRPSTKKLINVSTVSIQSARVTVIGPGGKRGEAVAKLANVQISATEGGMAKSDLSEIRVVDVSGENQEQAEAVAKAVDGEIGDLPEGETVPENTDILVIVN